VEVQLEEFRRADRRADLLVAMANKPGGNNATGAGLKSAKKGERPGGRKPGVPNKTTQQLKDAILEAADRLGYLEEMPVLDADGKPTGKVELMHTGKDQAVGYLMWLGKNNPTTFGGLLGRVMPLQVNLKTETKVNVKYETVEEVRAGLLERGMPLKMIEAMEAAMEPKFETQRLSKPPDQVQ
jgi:hypothetical protein